MDTESMSSTLVPASILVDVLLDMRNHPSGADPLTESIDQFLSLITSREYFTLGETAEILMALELADTGSPAG